MIYFNAGVKGEEKRNLITLVTVIWYLGIQAAFPGCV